MRRLAGSALVWFLAFVAVLAVVTVLLARVPPGAGWPRQAQVVLLGLGVLVGLGGTVAAALAQRGQEMRRAVVMVGAAVVLVAVAQVLGLFGSS